MPIEVTRDGISKLITVVGVPVLLAGIGIRSEMIKGQMTIATENLKGEMTIATENLKGEISMQVETIKGDNLLELEEARGEILTHIAEINSSVEQSKTEIEAKIAESTIEMQQQDLVLRQLQFDADEKARRDEIIRVYVPMLLGVSLYDRNVAIAVLVSIYPNDAPAILAAVAESQTAAYARILAPLIERAEAVDELVGDWIVAVSNDPTLEGAAVVVQKYEGTGYSTTVYIIEDLYVTTVGPYPSLEDAESAKITLRDELAPGAYVLNRNISCPVREYVANGDYYECYLAEE